MTYCSVQVICWRAAASNAWAVLLLPPITAFFAILSRFSLFHPIQTISGRPPHSFWDLIKSCFKLCMRVDLFFTCRMLVPDNKCKCYLLLHLAVWSDRHDWVSELGVLYRWVPRCCKCRFGCSLCILLISYSQLTLFWRMSCCLVTDVTWTFLMCFHCPLVV